MKSKWLNGGSRRACQLMVAAAIFAPTVALSQPDEYVDLLNVLRAKGSLTSSEYTKLLDNHRGADKVRSQQPNALASQASVPVPGKAPAGIKAPIAIATPLPPPPDWFFKLTPTPIDGLPTTTTLGHNGGAQVYGVLDMTAEGYQSLGGTAVPANYYTGTFAGNKPYTFTGYNSASAGDHTGWPTAARLSSNSSNIGFRGIWGNDNDLQAFWQFEEGIQVNEGASGSNSSGTYSTTANNSGTFSSRDQFIGLQGESWGQVKAGFLTSPLREIGGRTSFMPGNTSAANLMSVLTYLGGSNLNLNSRIGDAIQYVTPRFYGLQLQGMIALPKSATPGNQYTYDLAANYFNGPFKVYYAYEARQNQGIVAQLSSTDSEQRLIGQYRFQDTSFALTWDQIESAGTFYMNGVLPGSGTISKNAFSLAVMQQYGPNDFIFNVGRAMGMSCSGFANTGPCANSGTGASTYALIYHRWLYPGTMFQAYVSRIENDRNGTYDFDTNAVMAASTGTPLQRPLGSKPTVVGVGVRQSF